MPNAGMMESNTDNAYSAKSVSIKQSTLSRTMVGNDGPWIVKGVLATLPDRISTFCRPRIFYQLTTAAEIRRWPGYICKGRICVIRGAVYISPTLWEELSEQVLNISFLNETLLLYWLSPSFLLLVQRAADHQYSYILWSSFLSQMMQVE